MTTMDVTLRAVIHNEKEQRQRIMELEVALNESALALVGAHNYLAEVEPTGTAGMGLMDTIEAALVIYALPELGKSNTAEFGTTAEPSTTEQRIYDALGMG